MTHHSLSTHQKIEESQKIGKPQKNEFSEITEVMMTNIEDINMHYKRFRLEIHQPEDIQKILNPDSNSNVLLWF